MTLAGATSSLVEAGHTEHIRATHFEAGYPTAVDHGKQRASP
jgi:hypothetical protein